MNAERKGVVVIDGAPHTMTAQRCAELALGADRTAVMFVGVVAGHPTKTRARANLIFHVGVRAKVTVMDMIPADLAAAQLAGAYVVDRAGAGRLIDDASLLTFAEAAPPAPAIYVSPATETAGADQVPAAIRELAGDLDLFCPRRRDTAVEVVQRELERRALEDPRWSRVIWSYLASLIIMLDDVASDELARVRSALSVLVPIRRGAASAFAIVDDFGIAPARPVRMLRIAGNQLVPDWLAAIAERIGRTFPAPPTGRYDGELHAARTQHASATLHGAGRFGGRSAGPEREAKDAADRELAAEETRIGELIEAASQKWQAEMADVIAAIGRAIDHALATPNLYAPARFGLDELARSLRGQPCGPFDPAAMLALALDRVEFVDPGEQGPGAPTVTIYVSLCRSHPTAERSRLGWRFAKGTRRKLAVTPEVLAELRQDKALEIFDAGTEADAADETPMTAGDFAAAAAKREADRLELDRLRARASELEAQLAARKANRVEPSGLVDTRSARQQRAAATPTTTAATTTAPKETP